MLMGKVTKSADDFSCCEGFRSIYKWKWYKKHPKWWNLYKIYQHVTCYMAPFIISSCFPRVSKKPPKRGGNLKRNQLCTQGRHHTHCSRTAAISSRSSKLHRAKLRVTGVSKNVPWGTGAGETAFRGEGRWNFVGEFSGFPKKMMFNVGCERCETLTSHLFLGETQLKNHFWFRFWVNWFQGVPWIFFLKRTWKKMGCWQKTMSESWGVDDKGSRCHLHWRPGVFWKSQSSRTSSSFLPGHEDLSRTTPEITKNYRKV